MDYLHSQLQKMPQLLHPAVAEALYDAFQTEPFYVAIARARDNQVESAATALTHYFDFSVREAKKYGICYTLEDTSIGASIWHPPLPKAKSEEKSAAKKAFLRKYFGEKSLLVYEMIAGNMEAKATDIIKPDYWYLSILAVAQKHQGKGYGRQLLEPVLEQADELNVPTYLETFTKGNLVFYGKLGYEVAVEFVEPTLAKTGWILVRA
ncbi:MAG: GNAT family N-acetyltransferase [Bacteroidota bacterium]